MANGMFNVADVAQLQWTEWEFSVWRTCAHHSEVSNCRTPTKINSKSSESRHTIICFCDLSAGVAESHSLQIYIIYRTFSPFQTKENCHRRIAVMLSFFRLGRCSVYSLCMSMSILDSDLAILNFSSTHLQIFPGRNVSCCVVCECERWTEKLQIRTEMGKVRAENSCQPGWRRMRCTICLQRLAGFIL